MLTAHSDCFFYVADRHHCWIGLREPNPLADKWIGIPGFGPKPLTVKAKTADNPGHRLGGLVVDPTKCPEAFTTDTYDRALATWRKSDALPHEAWVVESGCNKGLARLNGKGIHADQDLMCIILVDDHGRLAPTSSGAAAALFPEVARYINSWLRIPMIQHGTEFQYDGRGAKETEMVYYYGPNRQFKQGWSSMPEKGH